MLGRIVFSVMIWQEAEYVEELESIAEDCRKVPSLLIAMAARRGMAPTSPEVVALLSMVAAIGQRCEAERENLDVWREDRSDPDEILEEIDEALETFVKTLDATLATSRS